MRSRCCARAPSGAATFLTVAQHGMIGDIKQTIDVTYVADTVIMLRYFEALGKDPSEYDSSHGQESHRLKVGSSSGVGMKP